MIRGPSRDGHKLTRERIGGELAADTAHINATESGIQAFLAPEESSAAVVDTAAALVKG